MHPTGMHAQSRESLRAASERLDDLAGSGDAATLTEVSEQLFAVVDLLGREHRLRRALSDPSTDGQARERLADALLGGQLGEATMTVLRSLVQARWSSGADFTDAVELLGVQAALAVAEQEDVLDDVEDELFRFGRILDRESALRAALTDSVVPVPRRTALLAGLLGERVRPVTRRLLDHVIRQPRGRSVERAIEELTRAAAQRRQRLIADVEVAAPLTDAQIERLGTALSGIYGRAMALQVSLNPTLLGGMTVRVADEVIDGSVARRLADARARFGGPLS